MPSRPIRLFVAAILLALAADAYSQERLLMVTEEWPPFRFAEAGGPAGLGGLDIDLCRRLEKLLGVTIEIQVHPWPRALEMLKSGQADMMTGVAYTAERAEYLSYVPTPYFSVTPVFYAPKGKGALVRAYEDLVGQSIGQSKSTAYFEPYNSDSKLTKITLGSEAQILQMLALGRIDLAIGTDPNISYDIARLGYRGSLERTVFQPAVKTDLRIALSKRSPAASLVERMDEAIRSLVAEGGIEAIAAKYR
ncbi:MAG: amino acid ABC transporter substrate-binding protein [Spirochaetaceae bacterium]|nr:amino acid ABC transporter substrate-binding protein [Spirochaetaceae bacterium]